MREGTGERERQRGGESRVESSRSREMGESGEKGGEREG